MFKITGSSGYRRGGGGSRSSRVSAASMGNVPIISTQQHRRPAFLPDTPQEQAVDSSSPRLGGLEKRY